MFKTMLIEENRSLKKLLKDGLKDQFPSMHIIEAGDGVEALQKIDSNLPDLVCMDIHLHGESGLELTRKIKADYPNIIIIMLTSFDIPEYREAATRNKVDYFFAKDSMATEISKLLKSILSERGFNSDGSKINR